MGDREAKDRGKNEWKQGEARLQWNASRDRNRQTEEDTQGREEEKWSSIWLGHKCLVDLETTVS